MAQTIKVGDRLPDIKLKNQDGQEVDLSSFRGKQELVLVFFPFAWSPVCTDENKCVTGDFGRFQEKNAKVFGVSVDNWFSQKAWKDALHLKQDFLSDHKLEAAGKLGLVNEDLRSTQRATVVVGKDGIVKFVKVQPVKEARNNAEILSALA